MSRGRDIASAQPPSRDHQMVDAAVRFGVVAALALGFVVLGVPTFAIGILALVLDGTFWPLLAGGLLIAGAIPTGWAGAATFRGTWQRLEREQTAARKQIFISYRTVEHADVAERIARFIGEQGASVFFAKSGDVVIDEHRPFTAYRALGLFQLGQLHDDLQQALSSSRVMVYLVPKAVRHIPTWQGIKDTLDALWSWGLFHSGVTQTFWRFVWYASLYGRKVTPPFVPFQTWQSWELSLARQLDLTVVKVVVKGPELTPDDANAVHCSRENLETDFLEKILPEMTAAKSVHREANGTVPTLVLFGLMAIVMECVAALAAIAVALYLLVRSVI